MILKIGDKLKHKKSYKGRGNVILLSLPDHYGFVKVQLENYKKFKYKNGTKDEISINTLYKEYEILCEYTS